MSDKISFDCKLYRGTAGSSATTLMTNVVDVSTPLDHADIDRSRRGDAWSSSRPGRKNASISWGMRWDPVDADIVAIRNAYVNQTAIALAALDALTGSGGTGLDCDVYIMKFERTEPNGEGVDVAVEAKPTSENRAPTYKTS